MKQSCEGFTGVNFPGSPRVLPLSLHLHSQPDRAAPGGEEERTRTMFWRPLASDSLFCFFFSCKVTKRPFWGRRKEAENNARSLPFHFWKETDVLFESAVPNTAECTAKNNELPAWALCASTSASLQTQQPTQQTSKTALHPNQVTEINPPFIVHGANSRRKNQDNTYLLEVPLLL